MDKEVANNNQRKYTKTILNALIPSFLVGYSVSLWRATYILADIKAGEYPEMPKSEIEQQYNEALPSVIASSIILGLGIMLLASIVYLFVHFKVKHNINIFNAVVSHLRKGKQ